MKHLLWGIGLLAALLALCLGASARLSASSRQTEALLVRSAEAARMGEREQARDWAERAKRCWDAHTPLIDAVSSHEETDEITRGLTELTVYAEAGRKTEFLALCARLTAQTAHLRQMERARWYTILAAEPWLRRFLCSDALYTGGGFL